MLPRILRQAQKRRAAAVVVVLVIVFFSTICYITYTIRNSQAQLRCLADLPNVSSYIPPYSSNSQSNTTIIADDDDVGDELYSSSRCVGEKRSVRTCFVQNMCLDDNAEFVYHMSPEEIEYYGDIALHPGLDAVLHSFEGTGYYRPIEAHFKFSTERIPQHALWRRQSFFFIHQIHPHNFGSHLLDNLFPLWLAAEKMNVPVWGTQVVLEESCADTKVPEYYRPDLAHLVDQCERMQYLWEVMTGRPAILRQQLTNNCFRASLVGAGALGLRGTNTEQPVERKTNVLVRQFRDYMYSVTLSREQQAALHRVEVSACPFQITFVDKAASKAHALKRRPINELPELVKAVRQTFGTAVQVQVAAFPVMDFVQQVDLISTTHVLITPWGGVSFGGIFLPRNAAMIVVSHAAQQMEMNRHWKDKHFLSVPFTHVRPTEDPNVTGYFVDHAKLLSAIRMVLHKIRNLRRASGSGAKGCDT
jgi:hypothetical protein